MLGPVVPPSGPCPNRIAILGEAPGDEESRYGVPFASTAGKELRRMLEHIGANLDNIYCLNVFDRQPPGNDLAYFTTDNPSAASRTLGPLTTEPTAWLADEWLPRLSELSAQLVACAPNVIIAVGNTAAWFLLRRQGISSLRGSVHTCSLGGRTVKVLPTYHPAAVLRQYSLRTISICDLEKALVEATTPDLHYDYAEIWTEPTLDDLEEFGRRHLVGSNCIALDVETQRGQITCLGLAGSRSAAIVVPFWNGTSACNYWGTTAEEQADRRWLAGWIEDPTIAKVTQNGLYDIQYLIAEGWKPRGFTEDTMLMHHSLWSELPKSLEYLGATFTNFRAWKGIHRVRADEQLKKEA
jgi:uracil-DNA glycosylase